MANVEEKKNELDDKKIFTSNAQRTTTVAKGETIIELKDVTIRFNKNNLKVDNLKEYFIRLVTKQLMFQEFIALKDINLDIKKGEAWGFLGTNGAGKSTLLKTLAAQLAPQGGAVLLDGKNLADCSGPERARKMALMVPHTRRTELTTCFEMASAGRYPYTGRLGVLSAEDKRQVHAALALVGAEALAGRDFNRISDGQRQRVLLARAICQQPELILLDEPTSFLDIKGKAELLAILKSLARDKKMAVILSLHELELAERISDTVVCVAGDRIDRIGTPEEIFTREYIAKLYRMEHGKYDPCFDSLEFVP